MCPLKSILKTSSVIQLSNQLLAALSRPHTDTAYSQVSLLHRKHLYLLNLSESCRTSWKLQGTSSFSSCLYWVLLFLDDMLRDAEESTRINSVLSEGSHSVILHTFVSTPTDHSLSSSFQALALELTSHAAFGHQCSWFDWGNFSTTGRS